MTRKAEVLAILARSSEPMRTRDLAAAASMTTEALWHHLRALLSEGLIQRSKDGTRGSKVQRRWRVRPEVKGEAA